MADGKKTVIMYVDIITTVEELDDAEAGRLFKHYLRYVNDLEPEAPDRLTKILFEPIKKKLKEDLKAWEEKVPKWQESGRNGGKKSGEVRREKAEQRRENEAKRSQTKPNEAKHSYLAKNEAIEPVNVIVNVNDNVHTNTLKSASEFNFDFVEQSFKTAFTDWFEYRKNKKPFTLQVSVEAAYRELKQLAVNSPLEAIKIVQYSIGNEYLSLVKKIENKQLNGKQPSGEVKAKVTTGIPDT